MTVRLTLLPSMKNPQTPYISEIIRFKERASFCISNTEVLHAGGGGHA